MIRAASTISAFVALMALLHSCSTENITKRGVFVDERDGREYKWINIGGVKWMAEDLQLDMQEKYHFYEALSACPEGWRLPSSEEWRQLAQTMGGYYDYEDTVGNPETGYTNLIDPKGFNGTLDAGYWTATPAWKESYNIRSDEIRFSPEYGGKGNPAAIFFVPLLKSFPLSCRCIQKESISEGTFQFQTDEGKSFDFSDHINSYYREDGLLFVHAYNLVSTNDADWIQFILYTKDLDKGDDLNVPLPCFLEYIVIEDISDPFYYDFRSYSASSADITVTKYSDNVIEGTLSGLLLGGQAPPDTLEVVNGTFSVNF